MQISCPHCSRVVPATELNMQQMVAKCTVCNQLFPFQQQLAKSAVQSAQPFDVPRPENLTLAQDGLAIVLRWRWFQPYVFILIPMAIFWNAIVFTFVSAISPWPLFFTGDAGDFIAALVCSVPLLIIPHVWFGLGLIYHIFCLLFNQTTLHVSKATITVRHSPLPWRGNKTIEVQQVEQLYTKQQQTRRRNAEINYDVHFIDRNNQHVKLVTGLPSSEHALYVEQEIERFLGIVDRPVRGEY